MAIQFHFHSGKAILAAAYLVHRLRRVEKVKLTKLLYLAEREHFLRYDRPITGDRLVAMPHGPVPSACLDLLNGEAWPDPDLAFDALRIENNWVSVNRLPDFAALAPSEVQVLDAVLAQYGDQDKWQLKEATHQLPEFVEVYREGTSTTIPYELLLKHSGDPRHFRHARPVISTAMAAHLDCPFQPDPDL